MKYLSGFVVTFLTFVLGVAFSPIHFYDEASGRGKVIDGGGYYGITVYTSSYFVKVYIAHASYVSPEKANAVFDQRLNEATKVIEVGPKVDGDGVVVGRRGVALFFSPEISGHYTEILWTDGRILHYIDSTSALHATEFEKLQR